MISSNIALNVLYNENVENTLSNEKWHTDLRTAINSKYSAQQIESIDGIFEEMVVAGEAQRITQLANTGELSDEIKNMCLPITFLQLMKLKDFSNAYLITCAIPNEEISSKLQDMIIEMV